MLSRRYQILLLVVLVLGVYYPSISGELNNLDDVSIVTTFLNSGNGLKEIFIPPQGWSIYYRPLINLSFLLDKQLWFFSESFMHLENILQHTVNTLLVYILTIQLLPKSDDTSSYLPLTAAACFGLHPLNTESVNWIAARTDIIACFFVLLSVLALIQFTNKRNMPWLITSTIFLVLGILTKEVAFALVPGLLCILVAEDTSHQVPLSAPTTGARKFLSIAILLSMAAAAIWGFLELRAHYLTFFSYRNKIGLSLMFIFSDPAHAVFVFLRAFGFYLKKFLLPWPLNFAIVEADPLYELLAMPLGLLCLYVASRKKIVSGCFTAGVLLITPAFLIAYNQIAWTPYAERYMYVPSALMIPAITVFAGSKLPGIIRLKSVRTGLVILLVSFISAATLQRNLVWTTNLSLYRDTVEKSPDFDKVRNEYGVALIKNGDYQEARRQLTIAKQLCSFEYDPNPDINLAYILNKEGKHQEAFKLYKEIEQKSKGKSPSVYQALITYYDIMLKGEKDPHKVSDMRNDMADCYLKLYELDNNPYNLYRIGALMNGMGNREKALQYYREAYEKFPERDELKGSTQKIIARLEKE